MDNNVKSSAHKITSTGMTIALRHSLAVLAMILLIGCSGPPQVNQPQGPSGIIVVTPATSATAVFSLGSTGQTFIASEVGYTGSFAFTDTVDFFGKTHALAPSTTQTSVTLKSDQFCFFGCHDLLQTVVVHDSFGNTSKIFAQ